MTVIKRWWNWFIRFWKGVWAVVKSMGNWKGVTSLIITWLTFKLLKVSDEKENEGD